MFFEAAQALLEFGQQHAMPDLRGVIFHHRTAQPGNLVAQALFQRHHVRSHIRAQRMDLRPDVSDVALRRHHFANIRHFFAKAVHLRVDLAQ